MGTIVRAITYSLKGGKIEPLNPAEFGVFNVTGRTIPRGGLVMLASADSPEEVREWVEANGGVVGDRVSLSPQPPEPAPPGRVWVVIEAAC